MLSFALIIVAALVFSGIITRTKSICAGRKGPGLFQPLKDVARLFKKGTVYSKNTTIIFKLAPIVYLASVLTAAACVPFGGRPGLFSFEGDFVFFAYVLALGKFFCIIAALDAGSSFEGMGASRESLYSMLAEPAFFLILGSLSLMSGCISFTQIFSNIDFYGNILGLGVGIVMAILLLLIAMIESSRLPIDDPKTHLELTMIHEVMILDNSGFDLGLILSAGYVKFAMYGALIANFFIIGSLPLAIGIFALVQLVCAVTIGATESFMARFRMVHNPEFIFSLTAAAFVVLFTIINY
ncbi:MAG: hypothetical protein GX664_02290 [Bacteroidales bacterium]|nr:hypothetical protein [Bacteroidales bacterium]